MKLFINFSLKAYMMLLFVSLSVAQAEDSNMQALLEGPDEVIHVGDVALLKLTVWPINQGKSFSLKSIEKSKVGESLFIVSMSEPLRSENNEEALTTDVYGVFLNTKELPDKIEVSGREINLLKRSLSVSGEVADAGEINVFSREEGGRVPWLIILLAIIVCLGAALLLNKKRKEKKEQQKQQEEIAQWSLKIKSARSRQDIEELYSSRQEWGSVLMLSAEKVMNFLKVVKEVQYKKEWDQKDWEEINKVVNALKQVVGK